jgi:hypothetical protein
MQGNVGTAGTRGLRKEFAKGEGRSTRFPFLPEEDEQRVAGTDPCNSVNGRRELSLSHAERWTGTRRL